MKLSILVAGAAATALIAGSASAMTKSAYAEPSQPVPYGQLNSYMKATPHQRTAMMSGAQTGAGVDTSATTPMPTAGADTTTAGAAPATPSADPNVSPSTLGSGASTPSAGGAPTTTPMPTPAPTTTN